MTRTALVLSALLYSACANLDPKAPSPVPMVANVDLHRFSGDWYLIAHIPTDRDHDAHNAIENYVLKADGNVAMTYTNRLGGFDGKPKRMTPTGFPVEGSNNALWGIRFLLPGLGLPWPFLFEYRVAHLAPDYSVMIVARSKLDFLWLFARDPEMSDPDVERYRVMAENWGYDTTAYVRVPQRWPEEASAFGK